MKEYIERQAVEEFIQDGLNNPDKDKAFGHDAIEILAGIHFMLAADVAPIRYAHWFDAGSLSCRCSGCGCKNDRETAYCPNCGAKMDGEQTQTHADAIENARVQSNYECESEVTTHDD